MKREFGRYQGDIQQFELWDPKVTQRQKGFYFTAVCEWLPDLGGWISVCEKCHNFRCLKIDIQKQTWQCSKCDRKGTFRKPEEKSEKKIDRSTESEKKGMKTQKQYLDDYTKKSSVKKKVNWSDYHLESEYEYKDKKGNVLWQKRKYRHKNGIDKICLCGHYEGKFWKVGIPEKTEKPLYRLPEFVNSKDKTCFICEGEKDTDNLRQFGHTVVCSPFGAKYWNPEFNQHFISIETILIPDNDEAGQTFEQKIGENLIKVTTVHVARIPKEYKDFSDWQAIKGNDKEAFKKLRFEKWKPKSNLVLRDSKNRKKREEGKEYQKEIKQGVQEILESVIDGQEFSEKKFEPEQFWISDGLIPKRGVVVLASYKGRGKTSFALLMSLKLSKGNCKFLNTFDIKDSPKKILFWYAENQPEEIQAIRNLQEESMNLNLTKAQRRILNLMPRERLDFVRRINIDKIKGAISELNPDIIIIDTVGWFLTGKKLNDAQTYFYLYDTLKEIKEDCLWLLITHFRKRSKEDIEDEPIHKIRGSGGLSLNASSVIMIDRFSSKKSVLYSKIFFELRRGKPVEPINTKFNLETRCFDVLPSEIGDKMPAVASPEDIRNLIKEIGKGEATPKQIITWAMKLYKLNDKTIYNLLKQAKDKGLISQEIIKGKTRGNKYHAL